MTPLLPGFTYVVDHPALPAIKEAVGTLGEDLMTFLVLVPTKRWVLGKWISESLGRVQELSAWDYAGEPDPHLVPCLLHALNPSRQAAAINHVCRELLSRERCRQREDEEFAREAKNRRKHMSKFLGIHHGDHPSIKVMF